MIELKFTFFIFFSTVFFNITEILLSTPKEQIKINFIPKTSFKVADYSDTRIDMNHFKINIINIHSSHKFKSI